MATTKQKPGRAYYIANCIERAINAAGNNYPLRRKIIEEIADSIADTVVAELIHARLMNVSNTYEALAKKQGEPTNA